MHIYQYALYLIKNKMIFIFLNEVIQLNNQLNNHWQYKYLRSNKILIFFLINWVCQKHDKMWYLILFS